MKFLYKAGANVIFLLHFLLGILIVFGWLVPTLWYVYMGAMIASLISGVVFGYCLLSKWEFDLRKKIDPTTNYNFTWATFYTYKISNERISDRFYKNAAMIALTLFIAINLYFHMM